MDYSTYGKVNFQQNATRRKGPSNGFSVELFALELFCQDLVDIDVINSGLIKRPDSMTMLCRELLQNFRQHTLCPNLLGFKPPGSGNKVSENINKFQGGQNLITQLKQNYLQPP